MYDISFYSSFKKDVKKLKGDILNRVKSAFLEIRENPYKFDKLTGDLSEVYRYKFRLNKVDYRLAYLINENEEIVIFIMFKKRENFYDLLRKRLN